MTNNKVKLKLASMVSVAMLSFVPLPAAQSADTVVEQNTIMTACKLFAIDSNAGLLSATQRVQIIQKRLDNALIQAKDLSPSAVRVSVENRNPVVTLDGFMIATADGNSATRNSMTKLQLAEQWAASLRMCISDSAEIQRYIAMLTGRYPGRVALGSVMVRDEIAVLNSETMLPLKLLTPISAGTSAVGDSVQAVVSTDVPLRPFFKSYLPAGTLAIGEIVSAEKYTRNNYAGKDAFTVNFYKLQTPDGKEVPIEAHILGGLNKWTMIHARPVSAVSCLDGPHNAVGMYPDAEAHLAPSKGYIVGAWKGATFDEFSEDNYPRMIFTRHPALTISAGEPLLLRFVASTALALAGKQQSVTVISEAPHTHSFH
jgi:hypothetical protein